MSYPELMSYRGSVLSGINELAGINDKGINKLLWINWLLRNNGLLQSMS